MMNLLGVGTREILRATYSVSGMLRKCLYRWRTTSVLPSCSMLCLKEKESIRLQIQMFPFTNLAHLWFLNRNRSSHLVIFFFVGFSASVASASSSRVDGMKMEIATWEKRHNVICAAGKCWEPSVALLSHDNNNTTDSNSAQDNMQISSTVIIMIKQLFFTWAPQRQPHPRSQSQKFPIYISALQFGRASRQNNNNI